MRERRRIRLVDWPLQRALIASSLLPALLAAAVATGLALHTAWGPLARSARWPVGWYVGVVLTAVVVYLAVETTRALRTSARLVGPVARIRETLADLAAGDTSLRLVVRRDDLLHGLAAVVNCRVERADASLGRVREAIPDLTLAVERLAQGDDLTDGSEPSAETDAIVAALQPLLAETEPADVEQPESTTSRPRVVAGPVLRALALVVVVGLAGVGFADAPAQIVARAAIVALMVVVLVVAASLLNARLLAARAADAERTARDCLVEPEEPAASDLYEEEDLRRTAAPGGDDLRLAGSLRAASGALGRRQLAVRQAAATVSKHVRTLAPASPGRRNKPISARRRQRLLADMRAQLTELEALTSGPER